MCQSVINTGVPWSHYYLGSLVLSGSNITFLVLTYRPTQIEFRRDRDAALQGGKETKRHSISFDHEISEKQDSCHSSTPSKEITSNKRKSKLFAALGCKSSLIIISSPHTYHSTTIAMGGFHVCLPILRLVRCILFFEA